MATPSSCDRDPRAARREHGRLCSLISLELLTGDCSAWRWRAFNPDLPPAAHLARAFLRGPRGARVFYYNAFVYTGHSTHTRHAPPRQCKAVLTAVYPGTSDSESRGSGKCSFTAPTHLPNSHGSGAPVVGGPSTNYFIQPRRLSRAHCSHSPVLLSVGCLP